MDSLEQKVAVVTGAASGIGRATAIALADAGCRLALVDIDSSGLSETQQGLDSPRVIPYEVDVSDADAMNQLADEVSSEFGAVHIVVNNAGINVTAGFEQHSLDDFQKIFDVNLWGVIHGCRAFLPHLKRARQGRLVNISSAFGIVGCADQTAYCASKFAVRGLSESLHEELAGTSVGVTVVHPGCIDTDIVRTANIHDDEAAKEIRSFFANYGCPPQTVADRIVDAIRHDRHRVLVTRETYAADIARRLFPTTGNRLANRVMNWMLQLDFR